MRAYRATVAAFSSLAAFFAITSPATAQGDNARQQPPRSTLLRPARVFDGIASEPHVGWVVLVTGERIAAVGPASEVRAPAGATTVDLPGTTLLPGLIEAHSHLLLHPYNETSWDDQVMHESLALRVARATNHARNTLLAGFTTVRDLGTEGAGYADVGLKQAIAQGIIPGPRMIVVTRAIVATGSYGPKGFASEFDPPQGAEEADGMDDLTRVVRSQIGKGADWIKVYADYRWGPNGESRPTFTVEELTHIVEVARSSGRPVVAHASTAEGMRRAAVAGVESIEHGDGGTPEVFKLMAEKGIVLCPTVAAGDAILSYRGWRRGADADPPRVTEKKASLKAAIAALRLAFFSVTRGGSASAPRRQPRYERIASPAATVGHSTMPFSAISRNTWGVPPSPCSIDSTPATAARRMPSAVLACATTGRPLLRATSTMCVSSSTVNVGRLSPLGPQR
jgi:imidazolonepropionase-like amidohydrolase